MAIADPDVERQFGEYFAARRDVVRRTAHLLCGDWHWADDLTQTAFMKLAVSWRKIQHREALDAYVHTCLVRAYLKETRRVWRRRERPLAALPDACAPRTGVDPETRAAFVDALRVLPAGQRAVLVCRFYEDLDVAATAEALGVATGTVKSQTAKGLARLRELVGDLELMEERS